MMPRFALVLSMLISIGACAGDAPIPITFYYSKKDPRLPDTEKALAEAVKQIPQLQIARVSIDDAEGYKQFAQAEKDLGVTNPGEMMVTFGPYYLTSKGERRHIEECLVGTMRRAIDQMKGKNDFKGRVHSDPEAYAAEIFGTTASVEKLPAAEGATVFYYRVTRDGKPAGWVVDAFKKIECPICSDAQFFLAASEKAVILDVRPVRELERFGAKLPADEAKKFVGQFKSKAPDSVPIKVDGISSATKTSFTYQTGINEILEELKKR